MSEIEEERQRLLECLIEDGHDKNFDVGSFGHHEAIDRSHIQLDNWDRHIADHPFVVLHPDLFEKARKITDLMADFYKEIALKD